MTPAVGDINEIRGFEGLLWEIVSKPYWLEQGVAYGRPSKVENVDVRYWGCHPNLKLDDRQRKLLKTVVENEKYRIEASRLKAPNEMLVIAISALDPDKQAKGRLPWDV